MTMVILVCLSTLLLIAFKMFANGNCLSALVLYEDENNNNNNNTRTMFMVLSSTHRDKVIARVHSVHLTNARQRQLAADLQT